MNFEREFPGPNLGYVLELYERYQRNPDSVDKASRRLFGQWRPANQEIGIPPGIDLQKLVGIVNLAQAIRTQVRTIPCL
jgi:2-oxoglutarate dehydrogenase E1 component